MKYKVICLLLLISVVFGMFGCTAKVQAADLTKDIQARNVSERAVDDSFRNAQLGLAVKLLQASAQEDKNENILISPLSVQLALSMTANGAAGNTLSEMETVLSGGIPIAQMNEYLHTYMDSLPSGDGYKVKLANSIWFRDDEGRLTVEKDFLQKNADYYGAQIYKTPFDDTTLTDINNWVNRNTDGMIDKLLDEIRDETVMYLINALVFDARWETAYEKFAVYNGTFTDISGKESTVEFMHSDEFKYISDSNATGFIKDYKDGKYSFAALLPNEDLDLYEYISGLTPEGLSETLNSVQIGMVLTALPKFTYDYTVVMNDMLKNMGMPSAFNGSEADLSKLGHSTYGNLYIGEVLHKTFISVDELGTKAGAVTSVAINDECAVMYEWEVNLDRPFVYMILDNATNLPIFIGAVTNL